MVGKFTLKVLIQPASVPVFTSYYQRNCSITKQAYKLYQEIVPKASKGM